MVIDARSGWRWAALILVVALSLAGCSGGQEKPADPPLPDNLGKANQELVIGGLLPKDAPLEGLGVQTDTALELALADINGVGGVLGKPVKIPRADSGANAQDTVFTGLRELLMQRMDVLVGPMTSSMAVSVKPQILKYGLVMVNPAATAKDLVTIDPTLLPHTAATSPTLDTPVSTALIARTVTDDVLLGTMLGRYIHTQEGNDKVTKGSLSVISSTDSYGATVTQAITDAYQTFGQTANPVVLYDSNAFEVGPLVEQVKAANPTSVVVVGLDEAARIVEGLAAAGFTTDGSKGGKRTYVAGLPINGLTGVAAGVMANVVSLRPGVQAPTEFRQRLLQVNPSLNDFSYAPEAYDAAILTALAAEAAQSDAGVQIAAQLQNVSRSGMKCTSFGQCKQMLAQGQDIDYEGVSGPCDLADDGNLAQAVVGVYRYRADNTAAMIASLPAQRQG